MAEEESKVIETKALLHYEEPLSPWQIVKEEIRNIKWLMLVFCCFLTFGSYYIYDFPGSLGTGEHHTIESKFYDHGLKYNNRMNLALYSVYSWPNTVLAFFGGLLIDKFLGIRIATLLFCTLVTLGSLMFWVGVLKLNYPLMVVARVVFGLGGESLSVAQSALIARWFRNGRGFALAFGITISFSRVGSAVNFQLSPVLCKMYGVDVGTFAGVIGCAISLLSAIGIFFLDKHGEKNKLVDRQASDTAPPFRLSDLKRVPGIALVIFAICVSIYCSLFPFLGVAKNFFQVKFGVSQDKASDFVSTFQFMCAGGSPVVGFLVDSVGRFCFWLIGSCSFFVLIHIGFLLTSIPAPAMMVMLGIAYSCMVSSLWPAIPYVVDPSIVGIAYGVMTALQNTGLAITPIIVGAVLDAHTPKNAAIPATVPPHGHMMFSELLRIAGEVGVHTSDSPMPSDIPPALTTAPPAPLPDMTGFHDASALFICMSSIAVGLCFFLYVLDRKHGSVLNSSPTVRKEILAEREALNPA